MNWDGVISPWMRDVAGSAADAPGVAPPLLPVPGDRAPIRPRRAAAPGPPTALSPRAEGPP